jgi:hypothetical protein
MMPGDVVEVIGMTAEINGVCRDGVFLTPHRSICVFCGSLDNVEEHGPDDQRRQPMCDKCREYFRKLGYGKLIGQAEP